MPPAALISLRTNWSPSSKLLMALTLSPLTSQSPMIFTGAESLSFDAVVVVAPAVVLEPPPAAAAVVALAAGAPGTVVTPVHSGKSVGVRARAPIHLHAETSEQCRTAFPFSAAYGGRLRGFSRASPLTVDVRCRWSVTPDTDHCSTPRNA